MASNVLSSHDDCTKRCPVSYYMRNPDLIKNLMCMTCGSKDKLWFCIFCGHVGCGHTVQSHAVEHYEQTQHRYVLGLNSFHVWDYAVKRFLHPLDEDDANIFNSFHTICSEMYVETNCACVLCQHNRTPKLLDSPVCMSCGDGDAEHLLICLHCRYIGCSRSKNRHALQHYGTTKHHHAMQLKNFSVWSYSEKKYLHGHPRYTSVLRLPSQSHN